MAARVYDNSSGVEVEVVDQIEFEPSLIKFQPSAWNTPVKVGQRRLSETC